MPLYSQDVQDELITQLSNDHITTLDFSRYYASEKTVKSFESPDTLDALHGVAFLPNGRVVSITSETLTVWDFGTGQRIQTFTLFDFVASHNQCVQTFTLWGFFGARECVQTFKGHSDALWSVKALPNGNIITTSVDKTLKIWDPETGQCLQTLTGHSDTVYDVVVLSNGQLVSCSRDKTLKVWSLETGECLQTLSGNKEFVDGVAVLPNGLVVSSSYSTLKVWNPETGECLQTLSGGRGNHYVTVLPNGLVVSTTVEHTLKVWDLSTGQCIQTLQGHVRYLTDVAVLPNGNVVSSSADKTLKVWDPRSGKCLQTFQGHVGHATRITVLPNGQVLSDSSANILEVWDLNPVLTYEDIATVLSVAEKASLKTLSLERVALGEAGLIYVQNLIKTHSTLEFINLKDTKLTFKQEKQIYTVALERQKEKPFVLEGLKYPQYDTQKYITLNDSNTKEREKFEVGVQHLVGNVNTLIDSNTREHQDFRQNIQGLNRATNELYRLHYQNIKEHCEIRSEIDRINARGASIWSGSILLPFLAGFAIACVLIALLYVVALTYNRYQKKRFENVELDVLTLQNPDDNLVHEDDEGLDNEPQKFESPRLR
ncbi:MAG: WD40 repeat domain-containing protein [Gammaproteobacteria bacterium]|nr:WD40 repeat domain-containing protein [Gammaproteobacteria bacterium]